MWTEQSPILHFRVDGTGPNDALLLHEIGGSLASWDRLAELAPPQFRLIRFDQRGFGLSEKPHTEYGLDELQRDASMVLEAANVLGRFVICAAAGSSALAIRLALEMPDRVQGLVLCSPTLAMDETTRALTKDRAALVIAQGMAGIADLAMERMFPLPMRDEGFADYRHRFLANDPVGFGLANLALAKMDLPLEKVNCPVQVLAGRHDIRPPELVAQAAERFPHYEFRIVEDGAHVLPVQAPGAILHALACILA